MAKKIMKLSLDGAIESVCNEAIVLSTYLDSKKIPTLGVGHTKAAGDPDPAKFKGALTIGEALELFRRDVGRYADDVNRHVKVEVTQYQFDALVDFHYNTGAIAKASLTKSLNAGNYDKAAREFLNYKKPPEIIERRKRSQHLFLTGEYTQKFALVLPVTAKGNPNWAKGRRVDVRALLGNNYHDTPVADLPKSIKSGPSYITLNATGPAVREWQEILLLMGYRLGKSGADSVFGPTTYKVTQDFQRDAGIMVDGRVGLGTRKAATARIDKMTAAATKARSLKEAVARAEAIAPAPVAVPAVVDPVEDTVVTDPITEIHVTDGEPGTATVVPAGEPVGEPTLVTVTSDAVEVSGDVTIIAGTVELPAEEPAVAPEPVPSKQDTWGTLLVRFLGELFKGKR